MTKHARPADGQERRRLNRAEFGLDPVVAVAWLYYEDQLNQGEIASLLGVSRSTVVNYLKEARNSGVVRISVAPRLQQPTRLARAIIDKYQLDQCMVIPRDGGKRNPTERLGAAGARVLSSVVAASDVLGVAWGKTVLALSQALQPMRVRNLSVVQIAGSMMATDSFSPELCTSNIASRLGGRCVNLHAPALASSAETRRIFMAEPALVEQFELIRSCNKIVFGVTHCTPDSTIFGSGFCKPDDSVPYLERGAVAVMAGRFLDRDGRQIMGHLDERMIGLSLAEIDLIPERICVAGGFDKVAALEAALTGGHITTLVTDANAAAALSSGS